MVVNLESVFPPRCVLLDLGIPDKDHVIPGLAKLLAPSAGVAAADIQQALAAREALGSTGVGGGVALPHARLHSLRSTHGVFVRLSSPVAFDAPDDQPVDLVCAIVAPDEPTAELLGAVSAVARVLRDGARTAELRRTLDAADARRILVGPAA